MNSLRTIVFGPWRAVLVLAITQILAWGALFYPPVLTVPLIAAERGWSVTFAMGGFSAGLLVGGLVAPLVGRKIDEFGGHCVMPVGSLLGAIGLVILVSVTHHIAYYLTWTLLGAAMAASLYDPAFATLGRIFGAGARRPITMLTFAGGFASTVSWPVSLFLIDRVGWRGTYLVYAALLAFVAAPLHFFALPRGREHAAVAAPVAGAPVQRTLATTGWPFLLVIGTFAAYAFVPSGLSAHLLAIFRRGGIDAATAVTIGALFGPSQVTARLCEFAFGRNSHPLDIARGAIVLVLAAFGLLALMGLSTPTAAAFAIMFGICNGLITISRGTVPLALFGANGYGQVVGRIAGPSLVMQSAAPLVLAFIAERVSDGAALGVVAVFAAVTLIGFSMVRQPR